MTLKAPFPYYGGKARVAEQVWARLGNPTVYVEPFAGSLAVLLARLGGAGPREIVCDTDGGICNLWRALQHDPEGVAFWADYPTIHQDLTAWHVYMRKWFAENSARLSVDPHFYDPMIAGRWAWGISLWIGSGWCQVDWEQRPHVDHRGGGRGVSAQTAHDKRPHVDHKGGGQGVSAQTVRDQIPHVKTAPGGQGVSAQTVHDQIPHVAARGGGQGVAMQRLHDQRPHVDHKGGGSGVSAQVIRPDLILWFASLQTRLKSVVVLNRSWESALTPTLLQQTDTGPKSSVGILMDPPYITGNRTNLYGSDRDGTSDDAAVASFRWAVENGERFRIAYCAHKDDFEIPDGWDSIETTFRGIKDVDRRKERRDLIMFSPACKPIAQQSLFR